MLIQENLSIEEKLRILSDAAKYDAACTSSGVGRKGKEGLLGNSRVDGICHSFASDGRCISLLKILFTNQCIYDCHYCVNRRSNDTVRTSFTPEEVCRLTMEFYRRNYIEGLFLSSGVLETPDHTMELLYQTLYRLRRVHRFNGYIHVKAIPGADPELIEYTEYGETPGITEELGESEYGTRSIRTMSWTVPNNVRKTSTAFHASAGESISVTVGITPKDKTISAGIIEPDGTRRYVNGKDHIDHVYKLTQSGKYRVYVENKSGVSVTVDGVYKDK